MTRKHFLSNTIHIIKLLEIIHTNIYSPFKFETDMDTLCFMSFIDVISWDGYLTQK